MSYHYIDSNTALAECCLHWQSAELLALDTEFIRTDTFYPILGLIQIGDGEAQYLIDPLCIDQWQPLVAVLQSPAVVKIVHSCSEDLEVLQRALDCVPSPLLDTQLGAALAGYRSGLSYQNLVAECLGEHVPKGETRSDWLQRPLTASQCDYAALDVLYLPQVFRQLQARLHAEGRMDWWREEGERTVAQALAPLDLTLYYRKVKSAWKLSRRQQGVLQRLCEWRERQARERDIPRGRVIKDAVCYEIARCCPRQRAQLADIRDLPPPALRRYGDELLALVKAGVEAADGELPPALPKPLPREQAQQMQQLRQLADSIAEQLQLPADLLVRKRDLEALLRSAQSSPTLPDELRGWREAVVGRALLEAVETL